MKKFITGLVVGALISFSAVALAQSEVKLMVDDQDIKCDVPPQIINGKHSLLDYDSENGFGEIAAGDYCLVTLFDQSGNFLSFYLAEAP
ncbi:MAG: hypothetical protein QHH02_01435 [Syntrophomonadaceae bacterium]|nr:hypothetical protein [Syntrophomonadaceae bacterium]